MSSFDDNIAELRGITRDDESDQDTESDIRKESIAATSEAQLNEVKADLERQPLLNHTSSSSAQPAANVLSSTGERLSIHITDTVEDDDENNQNANKPVGHSWSANMSSSMFFTLSTIYGATSVALGAFGAHGLKKRIADPGRIANWSTAAQYQLVHSVALLATSIALPHRAQRIPGTLFLTGMTLFSGSIYLLVLDPARFKFLGPVTPLGGLCLIGGWVGLGVVGRRFVR